MKIYKAQDDNGDGVYFATKTAAISEARKMAKREDGKIDVEECEVMPGKDGVVALANGQGWCLNNTVVFTKPAKSKAA